MNLSQIQHFILTGAELTAENEYQSSYRDRLKNESQAIYDRLKGVYPNTADLEAANHDLTNALSASQDVYMELGMKAGARLAL